MKKTIGYYLFALIYQICSLVPVKKNRVFCIMTHDEGEGSNVSIVFQAMQKTDIGYSFSFLTQSDVRAAESFSNVKCLINFFLCKPYELARAEIVLMDNVFLPYAYLRRRKGTKVVQLWHGTGTIKKFGQDTNTGKLKSLEKRANSNITHLIVNSPDMKRLYAGAFGVDEAKTYALGLPKSDEFLRRIKELEICKTNPYKNEIYHRYGIPSDKKLILYAPTFRDNEEQNPRLIELLGELGQKLPEEYCLGLRLHPHIAHSFEKQQLGKNICQLSFEKDVNTVLMAADLLITDYSSIIFEYCLLKRPMIFYAYDYENFSDQGRGFYYNYKEFVPGPVAYSCREVLDIIKSRAFQTDKIEDFIRYHYLYTDGNATDRLLELLKQ
jgi:CDP-ribitol ribitolphosphotransferase